ncbi:hypothetical protein SAMN05216403_104161 [Nitrosospira multiformis ATCC 25196]|uniref:Uncharacterized protein n=1 Tax=Nitrosospira multiformis (strain ATCC 25196 / NCIMB 11849 / C 71) TaxID=323848 RepID=A0A1H5THT6_NITMU|nr:hypothetical protein SAMN05216403_104161 [Nitrosospira multiformis ATCC 25196]
MLPAEGNSNPGTGLATGDNTDDECRIEDGRQISSLLVQHILAAKADGLKPMV